MDADKPDDGQSVPPAGRRAASAAASSAAFLAATAAGTNPAYPSHFFQQPDPAAVQKAARAESQRESKRSRGEEESEQDEKRRRRQQIDSRQLEIYDKLYDEQGERYPLLGKPDDDDDEDDDDGGVARRFGFPPTEDDASVGATARANHDDGSARSKTPTTEEQTKGSTTSFSIYNHETKTESFPIDVPPERRRLICACIASVWGVTSPRPFQVFAIFCMVYLSSQVIYLWRKTGEGKSIVFLTVAAMLKGVTIVLVPLIGLGSDQVNKCFKLKKGMEAWHVDEHKGEDFELFCERMLAIQMKNGRTGTGTVVLCSPQSAAPDSLFSKVLRKLAERNLITSVFVDEAHTIHRDGEQGSNFRPEFDAAYKNLMDITASQNTNVNVCIMSGTVVKEYEDTITKLGGREPTVVCRGDMARRNIFFGVNIFGKPAAAIKRRLKDYYEKHPDRKTLIFSNSKTNAETTLTSTAESVLEMLNIFGEVIALTGDCGVMMKTYLMAMFCGEGALDTDGEDDEEEMELPNLLVMPCTSAANCGVSSLDCYRGWRYSIPAFLVDLAQEMGRVDRSHDAAPGEHRYEIFLSFGDVMNLFLRIYQHASKTVREFEFKELYQVLVFVMLPQCCYHVYLEDHFEQSSPDVSREPCGNMCTFCKNKHLDFTKQFDRRGLRRVLLSNIFDTGLVTLSQFTKGLAEHAKKIYGGDEKLVKSLKPGNIHALALQLVASGFVEIVVKDENLIGKDTLQKNDLYVKLGKEDDELLILENENWDRFGFNCK